MATDFHNVWAAYNKALRTNDADDWRLYIALSDLYNQGV